jgi:hypothetical protein
MGVRYVVLTTAPADYSARGEARLLRSGASGLELVFRSATSAVYAVPSPQPIVTGPARTRVLALSISSITFRVFLPGTYRVAIRYTPYWSGGDVCIRSTGDGMFDVETLHAGIVRLHFAVTPDAALATITGRERQCRTRP